MHDGILSRIDKRREALAVWLAAFLGALGIFVGGKSYPYYGLALAALLAGARVRVERDALEYRRYRRTAPLGIYQKCAGLERRLREMGICVAGTGGR